MTRIGASLKGFEGADAKLGRIDLVLRGKARRAGLRAAALVVRRAAKRLAPRSTTRTTGKHLADTMSMKTKEYKGGAIEVAVVGPARPEGSHGHLVEFGHRIVGPKPDKVDTGRRSKAKAFLTTAVDQTRSQQQSAFIDALDKQIKDAIR